MRDHFSYLEECSPANLVDEVQRIAKEAGEAIMRVYITDFSVEQKADDSPLTVADMMAHDIILAGLRSLTPQVPILSEESTDVPFRERQQWRYYWLVDPLDGTREFIKRNGEFTVNIALIADHKPILGVVYAPVTEVTYFAVTGHSAYKRLKYEAAQVITVRPCPTHRMVVAGSRSHSSPKLQEFIAVLDTEVDLVNIGSSLKSCWVAEGRADVYPRFGPTSEWDTAAAQCIVEQAGGFLTDLQLKPLRYNTKESLINPSFVVFGDSTKAWVHYLTQCNLHH